MCAVKKTKPTNDAYVKQYIDQNSNIRFGTFDTPAQFNSKVDYTLTHIYEIMTTSEKSTLTQLCEIERAQFLTVSPLAQTDTFFGNRKQKLFCSYRRCFAVVT